MKRALLLLFVCGCSVERPYVKLEPKGHTAPVEKLNAPFSFVLDNGLTVIAANRPGSLMAVTYAWRAPGSYRGASEQIANQLFHDHRISKLRDALPAHAWPHDAIDGGGVTLSVRAEAARDALAALADVITRPSCDPRLLMHDGQEATQQLERDSRSGASAFITFVREFGQAEPRQPSLECATFETRAREVLDPRRSALILVGELDEAKARSHAATFAGIPRAATAAPIRSAWVPRAQGVLVNSEASVRDTVVIHLGRLVPRSQLDVLQLRKLDAWGAQLFRMLREHYRTTRVIVREQSEGVLIHIETSVTAAEGPSAVVGIADELESFARNVGDDMYTPVERSTMRLEALRTFQHTVNLNDALMTSFHRGLPADDPYQRANVITEWPASNADHWAERLLDPTKLTLVVSGERSATEPVIKAWSERTKAQP